MTKLLTGTAEDYREAVNFYKAVGMMEINEREKAMAVRAVDALRYAALRLENPKLTKEQLKECHGLIVYGYNPDIGRVGAGFVDVRRGGVVMLDHEGTWCNTWSFGEPYVFRFPPEGADIFPEGKEFNR